MTSEEARTTAKGMLKGYLESMGINTRKLFHCLSSEHADNHASMSYNEKTNTCRCFACGEHGDIFEVIRMQYGLPKDDYKAIFETTYRVLGIHVDDKKVAGSTPLPPLPQKSSQPKKDTTRLALDDFFRKCEARIQETDYPKKRGLTDEVIKRFHLGYDPAWISPLIDDVTKQKVMPSPRLIIPTSNGSYLARDTRQSLGERQKKYAKMKVGHVHIFNVEAFHGARNPVFLVEGEIDAMSIVVAGCEAGALGSTSNCDIFLEECRKNPPRAPIILCQDNDKWGRKAMARLASGLVSMGIPFLFYNASGDFKDPNERLQHDPEGLRESVRDAVKQANSLQKRLLDGMTPSDFVESTRKKLFALRGTDAHPESYWQQTFRLLNSTIAEVQDTRGALRILRIMAAGVSAMEKEFGRNAPEEATDAKSIAEKALREADKKGMTWENILDIATTVREMAKKAIEEIGQEKRRNPLLALPQFRNATPISRDVQVADAEPRALYAMAVKAAILENDAIGVYEADRRAVEILLEHGTKMETIHACLLSSPRIKHLKGKDRVYETMQFLKDATRKDRKEREQLIGGKQSDGRCI